MSEVKYPDGSSVAMSIGKLPWTKVVQVLFRPVQSILWSDIVLAQFMPRGVRMGQLNMRLIKFRNVLVRIIFSVKLYPSTL